MRVSESCLQATVVQEDSREIAHDQSLPDAEVRPGFVYHAVADGTKLAALQIPHDARATNCKQKKVPCHQTEKHPQQKTFA